jgi:hypothetical protein
MLSKLEFSVIIIIIAITIIISYCLYVDFFSKKPKVESIPIDIEREQHLEEVYEMLEKTKSKPKPKKSFETTFDHNFVEVIVTPKTKLERSEPIIIPNKIEVKLEGSEEEVNETTFEQSEDLEGNEEEQIFYEPEIIENHEEEAELEQSEVI